MNSNKLAELHIQLKSLTIFHHLLTQPIFIRLHHLLSKSQGDKRDELVESYAAFVNTLYLHGGNLSELILMEVNNDENVYVHGCAKGSEQPIYMQESLQREFKILQSVCSLKKEDFMIDEQIHELCSDWENTPIDLQKEYIVRMQNIHTKGYGMYSKHHMFMMQDNCIVPIRFPDTQQLNDFSEYERERNLIIQNTKALLEGNKASNMLLYGDAGTGKSSSIKAVVNAFKEDGLRLIEVKKNQLYQIPSIMEELANNPLKFILFIDDLSFVSNDENFAALKSILEGGVAAISNNVVIYATSNRRHLIKEEHQSRIGDEVHLNDTLQETMSLSSRFGLIITFNRPEKDEYLHIVTNLAKQHGVTLEQSKLFVKAEAYAIRHHGRSPRTAKQFIELVKAGI